MVFTPSLGFSEVQHLIDLASAPSKEKMLTVESKLSTTVPGDMRERGSPDKSGEKEEIQKMATHSCILAWEIPWTEEPGGLQSMGSQRAEMTSD